MPARRSRTERWRESLNELVRRNGPIEISVDSENSKSLVWRVRLLEVSDQSIVVEQPVTLRRAVPISNGAKLVGGIAIGQNRWMFHSSVVEPVTVRVDGRNVEGLRLTPPINVERCQRRSFYRISTASLELPAVRCIPLADPADAVPVEIATRTAILESPGATGSDGVKPVSLAMPSSGIEAEAVLINIGGGGACLQIPPTDAAVLDCPGSTLIQIDLTPIVPIPLPITSKLAHTKMDSSQNIQAGFSFDFSRHREYEAFVAEQVCRYVGALQQGSVGLRPAA